MSGDYSSDRAGVAMISNRRVLQGAEKAPAVVRELMEACATMSDDGLWARLINGYPMGCCYEGSECQIHLTVQAVAEFYLGTPVETGDA